MDKKYFLKVITIGNVFNEKEFNIYYENVKKTLNYNGEEVDYNEYLSEVKKNYYELEQKNFILLNSLDKLNMFLENEPKDKKYTVENIINILTDLNLYINLRGFNDSFKIDN